MALISKSGPLLPVELARGAAAGRPEPAKAEAQAGRAALLLAGVEETGAVAVDLPDPATLHTARQACRCKGSRKYEDFAKHGRRILLHFEKIAHLKCSD